MSIWSALSPPEDAPIVVLVHGAGMSAASWAKVSSAITQPHGMSNFGGQSTPGLPCVPPLPTGATVRPGLMTQPVGGPIPLMCAIDLRGHGRTTAEPTETEGFRLERLITDIDQCIESAFCEGLFGASYTDVTQFLNTSALETKVKVPSLFLIGHSLGGSIVAQLAGASRWRNTVSGVCLLDIVEDTARVALAHMPAYLSKRPSTFSTLDEAVAYMCGDGGLKAKDVKESVSSLFKKGSNEAGEQVLLWRTNLTDTEPFWSTWFTGMDDAFLSAPCPKMLMLAGTERLDKKLTIAQMQGKFQLALVRDSGHHIHEDQPHTVGQYLLTFVQRVHKLNAVTRAKMRIKE